MKKEILKKKIMEIISVPADHEGGTGYLKLTDEEIDKIVEIYQDIQMDFYYFYEKKLKQLEKEIKAEY